MAALAWQKSLIMRSLAAASLAMALLAAPALAASADVPQRNVDKSNDAGNSTGNDKVDTLNSGQLDGNQTLTNAQPKPAPAAAQPAAPK